MGEQITLKQARMLKGMSREQVCELLDINESTLYYWEKYKTLPNVRQFFNLCRIYELPADSIFIPQQ